MKWLWITALFFLVTGVKSGPARIDGVLVEWTIAKIERTDMGNAGASDKFRFTLSGKKDSDITWILLDVDQDGKTQVPVNATNIKDPQAPTFETNLKQYSGNNATFVINAFNNAGDFKAGAYADLNPFPIFPTVDDVTNLADPRPSNDGILIRLTGSLGSMSLDNTAPLITGNTNYYSFVNKNPTNYTPCNDDGGVSVCDVKLSSDKTTTTHDTTVSSAVLAYGTKPNATIKLLLPDTPVGSLEAILIPQPPQSPEKNALCTRDQVTGTSCTVDWPAPSSAVLQLIIIQKTTSTAPNADTWATYSFDIHDRELVATQLGADIIEGRWLMLGGEYSADQTGKSVYRLRKTVTGTNPSEYEDIEVDCSYLALDPRLCFGYFPHLQSGTTYTLTVAYNGNGTANEMDQIESSPVPIKASEPELEILSRHTTTHRNQQKADVQICFQHLTPTEGRSFSHYEMLIINQKGQWLKHRIMQEEEEEGEGEASEERLCFAPFTIDTRDFDLTEGTKVVVSQRAVDGVSVLASGESALF